MEQSDHIRVREVEEAGRQAPLLCIAYFNANPVCPIPFGCTLRLPPSQTAASKPMCLLILRGEGGELQGGLHQKESVRLIADIEDAVVFAGDGFHLRDAKAVA